MLYYNYMLHLKVQVKHFNHIFGEITMNKNDSKLFKIGEVTKIIGITRKTLLVYEDMKLLTPAVKDEESGYRYYSADNMTHIRSIRTLQALGLTLKEIKDYYYDFKNIDVFLKRLTEMRAILDRNIQLLQVRSAKAGDMIIHNTTLPRQVCFCRQFDTSNVSITSNNLRDTYIAAARTGKMSLIGRMFTSRVQTETNECKLICCIPMEDSFYGDERTEFPETPAICIYHRGPYEDIPKVIMELKKYLTENNIEAAGPYRSIYLEGPPNRGSNSANYITQVAIPIK